MTSHLLNLSDKEPRAELARTCWLTIGEEKARGVRPPLVSIIINNYNYGGYIGTCIDSIKAQDYPRVEVVIVDNASTDNTLEVIDRHVAGDARFTVIRNKQNDGPMGAFLIGLDATIGEFVCSVDSDDFMFGNFVSLHMQAHLAMPDAVAYTSSGVVEVGSDGSLLTAGRRHVVEQRSSYKRGLYPPHMAPRIPTVSDDEYKRLSNAVMTLPASRLPVWYPGSVNIFRRSAIMPYRPTRDDPLTTIAADGYFMAIDGYFAFTCHLIGASARIEIPLSAWRAHESNMAHSMPTLGGFRVKAGRANKMVSRRYLDCFRVILERAPETAQNLQEGRFWQILSLAYGRAPQAKVDLAEAPTMFASHFHTLVAIFGLRQTMIELRKLIGVSNLRAVVMKAYRRKPPLLALWLLTRFALRALVRGVRR